MMQLIYLPIKFFCRKLRSNGGQPYPGIKSKKFKIRAGTKFNTGTLNNPVNSKHK